MERSHGTPMYRLVEAGLVEPERYVQVGLRGYWPGEAEFAWQAEQGITSFFMHDVRDRGIRAVMEDALARIGPGPTSSPWTWTCSIPPTRRAPARPSRAA